MQQFWFNFLTTLTFLALASSLQLILENTDYHWTWISKQPPGVSWVIVNTSNLYHDHEPQFMSVLLFWFPFHGKKRFAHVANVHITRTECSPYLLGLEKKVWYLLGSSASQGLQQGLSRYILRFNGKKS